MRPSLTPIAEKHRAQDMLLNGLYAKQNGTFKGCSVGCMVHDIRPDWTVDEIESRNDLHKIVANYGHYPEWLAHLQDTLFEGLPDGDRQNWHVDLYKAIDALPESPDWQRILHKVHLVLLRISYANSGSSKEVVQGVINLHERCVAGEDFPFKQWSAAWSAAWSARSARSAAWSAAWSARSAAWSAAWSAARSAAWSARSAAWSAARAAAWSAAYQEMRDEILEVLHGEVTQ